MQSVGTNWVVGKSIQAKFYVDDVLWERCREVLDEQGVNLSEGMTRLCQLLVSAPDVIRPVLLRQAPGDAARVLARHVLDPREVPDFLASGEYGENGGGPSKTENRPPGSRRRTERAKRK